MDAVDRIVDQWRRERPDRDPSPMLVIGRLHRLAGLLEAELRPVFADAGLGDGDFDVLATLRRAGSPFLLTPGQLAEQTMVTTGATTKRLDRLQARGLIAREVSATDGRVRLVRLTDTGLATVDAVVERHLANEERLVAALAPADRVALAGLLSQWLQVVEGDPNPGPAPAGPRAPATTAR